MNRGLSLVTCLAKHKTIYNPTNQPCRCQFSLSTLLQRGRTTEFFG
jgi:hypothetical protein